MSKSDENPNSYILILDPPEVIRKKISRAVTDTVGKINYSDEQPGIKNLINILSSIKGIAPEEIAADYSDKGYAQLKSDVAETIIEELSPLQEKIKNLLADKNYLESIYKTGAEKANYVANKTLRKVQKKIGLIPR